MKKLNLPNAITILRICMIPVFMLFMVYDFFGGEQQLISRIIAAAVFIIAALTDMLDGKIARKRGLVTDFGKFLDPLADKFMIFGAMIAVLFSDYMFADWQILSPEIMSNIFFWCAATVIFRELAVTSIRLVVAKTGVVIAASNIAKVKTTFQMICISVIILEPVILPFCQGFASLVLMALMLCFTVISGVDYIAKYWKYLDIDK